MNVPKSSSNNGLIATEVISYRFLRMVRLITHDRDSCGSEYSAVSVVLHILYYRSCILFVRTVVLALKRKEKKTITEYPYYY